MTNVAFHIKEIAIVIEAHILNTVEKSFLTLNEHEKLTFLPVSVLVCGFLSLVFMYCIVWKQAMKLALLVLANLQ